MYCVIRSIAIGLSSSFLFTFPAQAVEVYLFKGAGDFSFVSRNLHFSRGLDRIADTLNAEGIYAEVRRFGETGDAVSSIRRRKPQSVAFIGHSMGAFASLSLAKRMRQDGIRVSYVGLIDIPGPVGSVGNHVERAENYYSIYPVYGRLTNADTHPNARNIHVFGQIHTTMDDSKKVREGMLKALREIHAKEQQYIAEPEPLMVESAPVVPLSIPLVVTTNAQGGEYQQVNTIAPQTIQPGFAPVPSNDVGQPVDLMQPGILAPLSTPQSVSPRIDPATTASVVVRNVVDTGKNIIERVREYISSANNSRTQRADRFSR